MCCLCFTIRSIWLQRLCIMPASSSVNSIKQSCAINKAKPKTQRCVVSIFARSQHRAEHTLLKSQQFKTGDKERARLFLLWLTLISKPVKCEVGQTLTQVRDRFMIVTVWKFFEKHGNVCECLWTLKCAKLPLCWYCWAKCCYKIKGSW